MIDFNPRPFHYREQFIRRPRFLMVVPRTALERLPPDSPAVAVLGRFRVCIVNGTYLGLALPRPSAAALVGPAMAIYDPAAVPAAADLRQLLETFPRPLLLSLLGRLATGPQTLALLSDSSDPRPLEIQARTRLCLRLRRFPASLALSLRFALLHPSRPCPPSAN